MSPELIDAAGHATAEAQTLDLRKRAGNTSQTASANSSATEQSVTPAANSNQQTAASSANHANGDDKVMVAGTASTTKPLQVLIF